MHNWSETISSETIFTNDSKYVLLFSAAKTLLILFMIDNLFKSKSAPVAHYV